MFCVTCWRCWDGLSWKKLKSGYCPPTQVGGKEKRVVLQHCLLCLQWPPSPRNKNTCKAILIFIELTWSISKRIPNVQQNILKLPSPPYMYITHLCLSPPNFFPSSPCVPPNSLKPNESICLFTPSSHPLSGIILPVAGSSLSSF